MLLGLEIKISQSRGGDDARQESSVRLPFKHRARPCLPTGRRDDCEGFALSIGIEYGYFDHAVIPADPDDNRERAGIPELKNTN